VQVIKGFAGQNSGQAPDAVDASFSERIRNFEIISGYLRKINGTSVYVVLTGSGKISMLEYLPTATSGWLIQRGLSLFKEASSTDSTISTLKVLNSTNTLRATRWKDAIYFVNGRDALTFLPNFGATGTIKQLGMYPPRGTVDNANSSVINGGSLTDASVYRWTITYFDPDTGTESPAVNSRPGQYGLFVQDPYASSQWKPAYWEETTAAPNQTGSITFAALNAIFSNTGDVARDARQTHFKLYRTTAGGTVFRQSGAIRNIATFIAAAAALTDGTADSTLGIPLQTDSASPPPRLERIRAAIQTDSSLSFADSSVRTYIHMREFKDSLFGFGAYGPGIASTSAEDDSYDPYKSILYIHDTFIPDYVFTTRDVADGDGQLPTGVAVLGDNTLILLKESSIYYLSGTNVRNYEVRPLDTRRGCIATGSIQETPYGVICLDRSGVVLIDAIGPAKDITDPFITDVIDYINLNAVSTVYSTYDRDTGIYRLSIPIEGSTKPNRTIMYNVKDKAWSYAEGQEGYSQAIGIGPSKNKIILVGDSVNQNKVLNASSETNVLHVAQTIEGEWLSSMLYLGDPTVKKRAKFLYVMAESNQDWTITVGILPDYGQYAGECTVENVNSTSNYAVWAASLVDSGANVGVFDTSLWSGRYVRKMIKIPVGGVGYGFQIRIQHLDTVSDNYGFRLLSVKLECTEMGK